MAKSCLVNFGAGNIGRSFIGQVFSRGGYEVVFVDIDQTLVDALNERGEYRVVVKENQKPDEVIWVGNVRALHGGDGDGIAKALQTAAYASTSVGKGALPAIMPLLAGGLNARIHRREPPLDIIIAENIMNGAAIFRKNLAPYIDSSEDLEKAFGLVETSIGKMVPLMSQRDRETDPLWIFAEAYNNLIVDRHGFLGPLPDISDLKPVENIRAYVDRKLFIHNLGHAAGAYLGFRRLPSAPYLYEVLEDPEILSMVRASMREAADALNREYPQDLSKNALDEHIDELLSRFRNRALKDTIYRIGRDLYRKLSRDDRLVGAMLLASRHGLDTPNIARAVAAGFDFNAGDENGRVSPDDVLFHRDKSEKSHEDFVKYVCGLDDGKQEDGKVLNQILAA